MLPFGRWIVVAAALLAVSGHACDWPDELPPGQPPVPPGCGDGSCDTTTEDCHTCAADCGSCCTAVSSVGNGAIAAAENAVGPPDSKQATLGELSSLVLVVGREINNPNGTGADFTIHGEVLSVSQAQHETCSTLSTGSGALEVRASTDGVRYELVGLWSQTKNAFDLGCARLATARYIRIDAQLGASARLDALEATSCYEQ